MPVVTKDATALKWFPASSAEMASLVSGRSALTGLAASLSSIWGFQDASGAATDSAGSQPIASAGGNSYQNAVTGYSRLGARPSTSASGGWADTVGPLGDVGSTSQFLLAHIREYSAQGSDRDVIGFGGGGGFRGVQYASTEKLKYCVNDASATATGTANPSGGRWVMVQSDLTHGFNGIRTDQETIQQSPNTTPSYVANRVFVGAVLGSGANVDVLWMSGFRGSGSEISATGWAQLLDCLNNGPAVNGLVSLPNPVSGTVAGSQQLAITGQRVDSSSNDVTAGCTYSTSNAAVATVSSGGLVSFVGAGSCNITATYTSLGATTAVVIVPVTVSGGVTLTGIDVTPTSPSIVAGSTLQMSAKGSYSDGSTANITSTVTWTSGTPAKATVSSSGLVSAVAAGSSVITATLGAISGTDTVTITAAPTLAYIAVTPASPTLAIGGTQQMVATGTYSDASTANLTASATWTSGTPANATVTSTGLVAGIAVGSSVITASVGAISGYTTAAVNALAAPNKYSRMMMALLPPGRLWRTVASGTLATVFAGCADELGRVEARTTDLLNEADPSTAVELLPEYESELRLPSTGTTAERQARVVSRTIVRQRYRPVDFQNALAPLLALAPANVVIIERTHAQASAMGDDREIFRFFIYRDPTQPGTYYLASAQALVNTIKPSHTIGTVIESVNALYDSPFSLYDRDLMGA